MAHPKWSAIFRQCLAGFIGTLGVMATGAAYTWPEPLTMTMTKPDAVEGVPMTVDEMSWIMSIIELGSTFAPIPSGYLAEWYGRKLVNWSIGPLCLISWMLVIFTRSLPVLYIVRVIHGFAVATAFTVNPIYTAEISDPAIRGLVSGIFQVTFYGGALFSFCIGPFVSYEWYAYAQILLPLIFTVTFFSYPETPYWLLKHGKEEEAKKSLRWFRCEKNVDKEFDSMKKSVKQEMESKGSWKTLFTDSYERKAFILLQIVSVSKFLTGMPTIISYASETFAKSDSFLSPSTSTIILGIMLSGIGAVSAVLADHVGRKALLLVSCFGCFVAHTLTTIYYYLHEKTDIDASPYVWLMYFGISAYCVFSGIGLNPLFVTLQAELFGAKTREIAGGITETFAGLMCFIIIKVYQPISDTYGVYVNFLIYGVVGLVGGIMIAVLMFETSGKIIGRMEKDEKQMPQA